MVFGGGKVVLWARTETTNRGNKMSGGSWDYFYEKVEEVASRLQGETDPVRRAFGTHLKKCAKALHDIEWVDSCDMGKGDEVKAIKAALGTDGQSLVLYEVRQRAEAALQELTQVLNDLRKK